jgi:hypothetical protein
MWLEVNELDVISSLHLLFSSGHQISNNAVILLSDGNTVLNEIVRDSIGDIFVCHVNCKNDHVEAVIICKSLVNMIASSLLAALDTYCLNSKSVLIDTDQVFVSDKSYLSFGESAKIAAEDKRSFRKGPHGEVSLLFIWSKKIISDL